MASNSELLELLEEMLDSGKSSEEVCRDCPELLPEVRQRWQEFQRIDREVRTLLPGIGSSSDPGTTALPESVPEPPAAFGRYEVRDTLGVGGFGAVYLGHDSQLNRAVAVKAVRARASAGEVDDGRALQEARQLAQLRHPGIVAVHDVGVQDGQIYIVSDYLDGSDLHQWLQSHRPTWQAAATVAAAVADALGHAHARLIIHRDIKPANILLTADGAPILVDFGLALDESQAGGNAIGIIAGTPWYMSPEQATGLAHRIDGRTDIYSLGVVLYEMLTGRVPFRAAQTSELLRQIREDEPQPPRQLVGDIPPELERVCLKALAKQQQDRYTTAADFAADLRRMITSPARGEWTAARSDWSVSPLRVSIKRHTVGRQKELADLSGAFDSAAAGQGLFVCVTGEPGIGKTTLVEDFFNELAETGRPYALARGRCSERLAGTEAYLPFLEALESLINGEEGESASQVMKTSAPNWYDQVAPLAAKDSSLTRVLAESRAASQERLKRELSAFLREVSQLRPLILFIDDLHWADSSTVDLLAYLGGKCAGMRVLLLFTYRPSDLAISKHPFGPVKLDLQARGVCRELALEFLLRADLDRYLALEFPDHSFSEEFTVLVHDRTEGSPLFMADLLRYLRDRQVLVQEQSRWTLRQSLPDLRRDLPESVRGMIQRKIDQLGDDDRRLLLVASVQGYQFDSSVVARVLERDAEEVEDRLDELDRVHAFVRKVREQEFPDRTLTVRYHFVHVLYQNTLYDSLQPTRRASLSATVAQTLLGYYGDRRMEAAAELALLLEAARDYAGAADYFLAAAQNSARVFANHEAVVLARKGIELLAALPVSPERSRKELALQITLGPALFATKEWTSPEVESAYTQADALCSQLGDSPDHFRARWGLFLFRVARGEIQQALALGEQLQNLAKQSRDPAQLLQAYHATGPILGLIGDWASSRKQLEEAVTYYDRHAHADHNSMYGGHDPCACCQGYGAKALWMLGYPDQAMQLGNDALALARDLKHPTSLAHTQFSVAILHQFRREAAETLNLAEELQKLTTDQGLLYYLPGAMALRGWALVELGDCDEGLDQMRQAFELGGVTRAHWRSYSLALHAEACRKVGQYAQGLTMLEEARTIVESSGIRLYEPEVHRLTGELLLALDPTKTAQVEACFQASVATSQRYQAKSLELRATMSQARLSQKHGRSDAARTALAAIYGTYTEGFTTPDLVNAAAQLKGLS